MYMLFKHLHMTCAMLTLISFAIRGFWMLTDNSLLQRRWVKIAPHIIDTLLLLTAVGSDDHAQPVPVYRRLVNSQTERADCLYRTGNSGTETR